MARSPGRHGNPAAGCAGRRRGEIGTEYLLVEQDIVKGSAIEAVTLSYNNLKAKGYA